MHSLKLFYNFGRMNNPDAIFIDKEKVEFQVLGIAVLLIGFGLRMMISNPIIWWQFLIGTVMILTAIVAVTLRSKTFLDCVNGLMITETHSFYYHKEKTEKLPDAHYVSLAPVTVSQRMNFISMSSTSQEMKCNLNLVFKKGSYPRYKTLRCLRREHALELARNISEKGGIPVLDCTAGKQEWVEWHKE